MRKDVQNLMKIKVWEMKNNLGRQDFCDDYLKGDKQYDGFMAKSNSNIKNVLERKEECGQRPCQKHAEF